jgi:hypothetical protein
MPVEAAFEKRDPASSEKPAPVPVATCLGIDRVAQETAIGGDILVRVREGEEAMERLV